jgi:O-antigen ligase
LEWCIGSDVIARDGKMGGQVSCFAMTAWVIRRADLSFSKGSALLEEVNDLNKAAFYLLYAFAAATVLPMSATTVVLGLLIIVFAVDLFRESIVKAGFKRDSLLYVAIYVWKAFTRVLATLSAKEILKIKGVWDRIPYIVIGFYKIHRDTVLRIFHILFIANVIIIVYALGQKYLGIPPIYKPLIFPGEVQRISGYFGHPNQYGGCISIILIANICLAIYYDKRFFRYSPILLIGLVFAGSRSYFLGIFVCFVIILLLSRSFKKMMTYSLIALVAVAVIALTLPWFSQRVADSFSVEKNIYRLNIWRISWNAFLDHPVTGVGSGLLRQHLAPYVKQGLIDTDAHAHSLYLHELAEGGIPGFILVVGVHIYFLIKYFKVFSGSSEPLLKALSLGMALSWVNLLVAGVFEYNFGAAIVALNINFLMGVLEGYRLTNPTGQDVSVTS